MTSHTYEVRARRDGKFWFLDIPGVGATQARTLTEVDEMAVDYIAGMTDVDESDVTVDVSIELPEPARSEWANASAMRNLLAFLQLSAATQSQAAARSLKDSGLTVREIGRALGLSYQRAQQLLTAEDESERLASAERQMRDLMTNCPVRHGGYTVQHAFYPTNYLEIPPSSDVHVGVWVTDGKVRRVADDDSINDETLIDAQSSQHA